MTLRWFKIQANTRPKESTMMQQMCHVKGGGTLAPIFTKFYLWQHHIVTFELQSFLEKDKFACIFTIAKENVRLCINEEYVMQSEN
jgi:hypothetical protein